MTPVDQTRFGPGIGNCFAACVASILDLSLDAVVFVMADGVWLDNLRAWASTRGLVVKYWPARLWAEAQCVEFLGVPRGYSIMSGESPRHPGVMHSVVALDGVMVHDPNPSRAGVLHDQDHHDFVTLEPA